MNFFPSRRCIFWLNFFLVEDAAVRRQVSGQQAQLLLYLHPIHCLRKDLLHLLGYFFSLTLNVALHIFLDCLCYKILANSYAHRWQLAEGRVHDVTLCKFFFFSVSQSFVWLNFGEPLPFLLHTLIKNLSITTSNSFFFFSS